jgi:hypothetical protein
MYASPDETLAALERVWNSTTPTRNGIPHPTIGDIGVYWKLSVWMEIRISGQESKCKHSRDAGMRSKETH